MTARVARRGALWLLAAGSPAAAAPRPGAVRLGGGNTDAGRVEILQEGGRWGTICLGPQESSASRWSLAEAEVVCRELGLRRGVGVMRMANAPELDVVASGAACRGSEASFAECLLPAGAHTAGDGGGGICREAGAAPATAGVRCSNFFAEEQPEVSVDLGGHAEAELPGLLRGHSHGLRCDAEPVWPAANNSPARPRFQCRVFQYSAEAGCETGTCETPAAPDPFDPAAAAGAYVFEAEARKRFLAAAEQRAGALAAGASLAATDGGIEMSPLGLRFASGDDAEAGTSDSHWSAVKALYLSPFARMFLDLDELVLRPASVKRQGLSREAAGIFESLEADGVARISDLGLDFAALRSQALGALAELAPGTTSATAGGVAASRAELPELERWLRENATLPSAVAAYLGGQVTLHGYKAVHLPASLSTAAYVPSHWHHDRAGRRLKLFIPLHDIDPQEGHPTQIARGSHDLVYFWHEEFEHTRFANSYVHSAFEVERLAGRAGGGYLFDTNALHKGTPEGSHERDVVVVEFHHAAKCGLISTIGLNVPCPSGEQRPLNWYVDRGGVLPGVQR